LAGECAPDLAAGKNSLKKPARLPGWRGKSPLKGGDVILSLAMVETSRHSADFN
jgi:hypothetical protein